MMTVMAAMLCKEQGITITGICAVYELIVVQKVSFFCGKKRIIKIKLKKAFVKFGLTKHIQPLRKNS